MQMNTKVWIRIENKGQKDAMIERELELMEAIKLMIRWLSEISMRKYIQIRIARNKEDLDVRSKDEGRVNRNEDTLSELDKMLAGIAEDFTLEPDSEAEPSGAGRLSANHDDSDKPPIYHGF